MINITLPHIAIHKAENGWVVQWSKPNPDKNTSQRTISVCGLALNDKQLIKLINKAASELPE